MQQIHKGVPQEFKWKYYRKRLATDLIDVKKIPFKLYYKKK